MPEFLITGATGTVGSALTRLLARCGATIRAMSRNPNPDSPSGVEGFAGDLSDPAAVADAVEGVQRVFLLTGGPEGPHQDRVMADAVTAAGVNHLVKLSVLGLTEGAEDILTGWHRDGEAAIRAAGVPANFLRPGAFMSNTVNWAPTIASDRTVYAPLGDLPVACIDPLDIATVACHLLTEPGPAGQAYPLTGPDAITPREQAATLAELIGHPITFVETSPEQARKTMVSYGMPDLLADAVIASMTGPLHGHGQTPMPTVEQVTGVPARNYRTWAAAHLDAFTAPAAW